METTTKLEERYTIPASRATKLASLAESGVISEKQLVKIIGNTDTWDDVKPVSWDALELFLIKKGLLQKTFLIECQNSGSGFSSRTSYYYQEGSLEELIKAYSYTLECGASYQHEKGNAKINCSPKSVDLLVKNLNNAVNNSAANGYAGKHYSIVTERKTRA